LAGDTSANPNDRLKATEFLSSSVKAMEGYGIDTNQLERARPFGEPSTPSSPHISEDTVSNAKSVNPANARKVHAPLTNEPVRSRPHGGASTSAASNSKNANPEKVFDPGSPPKISAATGGKDLDNEVKSTLANTPGKASPR